MVVAVVVAKGPDDDSNAWWVGSNSHRSRLQMRTAECSTDASADIEALRGLISVQVTGERWGSTEGEQPSAILSR